MRQENDVAFVTQTLMSHHTEVAYPLMIFPFCTKKAVSQGLSWPRSSQTLLTFVPYL